MICFSALTGMLLMGVAGSPPSDTITDTITDMTSHLM
jgi:hypothetical protein